MWINGVKKTTFPVMDECYGFDLAIFSIFGAFIFGNTVLVFTDWSQILWTRNVLFVQKQ